MKKSLLVATLSTGLAVLAWALPAFAANPNRTASTSAAIHSINGSPKWLAAISASTTAACATITAGKPYVIRSLSSAFYYQATTAAIATVTTSSTNMGHPVAAATSEYFTATETDVRVCVILASGTDTVNIWELR